LRLVVLLSALSIKPCAGALQQNNDVTSRTIQAHIVLEGRVDWVESDSERGIAVVYVTRVFKDCRLRRAASAKPFRLRVAVDFGPLNDTHNIADNYYKRPNDNDADNASPSSLTRGARLILFLRHRDSDAMLTYDVTLGRRRRQQTVDLYRISASPEVATESARKTVEKFSKRRNGQ